MPNVDENAVSCVLLGLQYLFFPDGRVMRFLQQAPVVAFALENGVYVLSEIDFIASDDEAENRLTVCRSGVYLNHDCECECECLLEYRDFTFFDIFSSLLHGIKI